MWQRLNINRDEAKRISAVATGIFGIKWRYDPDSTLILLGQTLNGSPGFDVDGVVVDGNGLPYRSTEEFVARHAQAVLQLLETGAWVLDPPADAEHAHACADRYLAVREQDTARLVCALDARSRERAYRAAKLDWARWLIACLRTPRMFVVLTIEERDEREEASRSNPNPEIFFNTQARDYFFHRMRALLREETQAQVGLDETYPCMFRTHLLHPRASFFGRRLFPSELLAAQAVHQPDDAAQAAGEAAADDATHEPEESEAMAVDAAHGTADGEAAANEAAAPAAAAQSGGGEAAPPQPVFHNTASFDQPQTQAALGATAQQPNEVGSTGAEASEVVEAGHDAAHTQRVSHIRDLARSFGFRLVPVGDVGGDLGLCKVCYTRAVSLLSVPCEHAATCEECEARLRQSRAFHPCIICKEDVLCTRKIYLG